MKRREYVPLTHLEREIDKRGRLLQYVHNAQYLYDAKKVDTGYRIRCYLKNGSGMPIEVRTFATLRELALAMREIGKLSAWSYA